MRNLKKILALVLALMMTVSVMVTAGASNYVDGDQISDQYAEAVEVLTGMGIYKGQDAGNFAPKSTITRAETSALVYRILTGDVKDAQTGIYADYNKFEDVASNSWYAGYVNYAANGKYIMGDGQGHFYPMEKVTGYQVLAIMLRAMGYGQNGEFEGAGWEIRTATQAKKLGITDGVTDTTLGQAATREVVAHLLFQAIQEDTVVYTPALGYVLTDDSLGWQVFGLTSTNGIVVGNQATGEKTTKVSTVDYTYGTANNYDVVTDLNMFGHAAKVWYNGKDAGVRTTYAIFDKATNVAVMDKGLDLAAYKAAGFTATHDYNTYRSDAYEQLNKGTMARSYPFYVAISNNANLTPDVLIGVDASVELVTDINNYVANPTVTFSTTGTVAQAKVTSGLSNAVVGKYVIVNDIIGTTGGHYYTVDTVTNTVTSKIISVATDGTVTLADGSKLEKSPLFDYSDMTKVALVAGVELTFTLDNNGKYIGVAQPAAQYLYATYAYWEQTGTSTITYYLQGVTVDGQITTVATNKASYDNAVANGVSYKHYGNDTVVAAGYNMMELVNGTWKDVAWADNMTSEKLTATSDKIDNNVFLGSSTVYHVIAGFGDTLTVTPYTGVAALVGDATSVTVSGPYTKTSLSTSTVTNNNWLVNNVLVSNISYEYAGNYFYAGATAPTATATSAANANVKQYEMYVAGAGTTTPVWVDTSAGATPVANTFYSYTKTFDKVLGADVYTLTAVDKYTAGGNTLKQSTLTVFTGTAQNYIQTAGGVQIKTADNVSVIDLTNVSSIDTVAKLNDAAQNNTIKVDCLLTADRSEVVAIYVTSVVAK